MAEILVTESEFATYRDLNNIDYSERMQPKVLEAQRSYIRHVLGKAQYKDLIDNQTDSKYVTLLDGGTYNDGVGTVDFYGLKPAIIYYAYGLFIHSDDLRVTRAGNKVKRKAESDNADKELIEKERQKAFNTASMYMRECLEFMRKNPTDYPLLRQHDAPATGFRLGSVKQHSYRSEGGNASVYFPNAYHYYLQYLT